MSLSRDKSGQTGQLDWRRARNFSKTQSEKTKVLRPEHPPRCPRGPRGPLPGPPAASACCRRTAYHPSACRRTAYHPSACPAAYPSAC
eukprot:146058-Rhodomonas_salina.1